jgi:simple sugar transport system substrate-binding protein
MVERFAFEEGPIRVAEISGTPDSSPTIGRYEGLREVLGAYPKFEIVISISGDFMRSKGRECMELILEETPDIDILFAHNDDMALGAIEVLEEHGIRPGLDIIIVSVDAQTSGLEALREGKINCLVECSPYVGDDLMELIFRIMNGEPFDKYTYTETRLFTDMDDPATFPVRPPSRP